MNSVIIYRGLPGCGKTTATACHNKAVVFSADSFFMKEGQYNFDPAKIGEAHARCFREFLGRLTSFARGDVSSDEIGVVDNTNANVYELAPYVAACSAFGVEYEIRTLWVNDPVKAWKRNRHLVHLETVFKMYQTLLSERLPPFWNHKIYVAD